MAKKYYLFDSQFGSEFRDDKGKRVHFATAEEAKRAAQKNNREDTSYPQAAWSIHEEGKRGKGAHVRRAVGEFGMMKKMLGFDND